MTASLPWTRTTCPNSGAVTAAGFHCDAIVASLQHDVKPCFNLPVCYPQPAGIATSCKPEADCNSCRWGLSSPPHSTSITKVAAAAVTCQLNARSVRLALFTDCQLAVGKKALGWPLFPSCLHLYVGSWLLLWTSWLKESRLQFQTSEHHNIQISGSFGSPPCGTLLPIPAVPCLIATLPMPTVAPAAAAAAPATPVVASPRAAAAAPSLPVPPFFRLRVFAELGSQVLYEMREVPPTPWVQVPSALIAAAAVLVTLA
jgi:hypothetical protein